MEKTGYISKEERLALFRRSESSNLLAEVFLDELQFILGEDILEQVVVANQGMNPRVKSKDILDVKLRHVYALGELVELVLARNSIYHQLPESLFHPLTLSKPNMSQRELIEAIRQNRRKEKEALHFFAPFDTAFFKERVRIHRRYLNFFSEKDEHPIRKALTKSILYDNKTLTPDECQRLFFFAGKSDASKENLSEIGILLHEILNLDVELQFKSCKVEYLPYPVLGKTQLGLDAGLDGVIQSEIEDVEGMIHYHDSVPAMKEVQNHIESVKYVLGFFILSARKTNIKFTLDGTMDFILGNNRLGYDTQL